MKEIEKAIKNISKPDTNHIRHYLLIWGKKLIFSKVYLIYKQRLFYNYLPGVSYKFNIKVMATNASVQFLFVWLGELAVSAGFRDYASFHS